MRYYKQGLEAKRFHGDFEEEQLYENIFENMF